MYATNCCSIHIIFQSAGTVWFLDLLWKHADLSLSYDLYAYNQVYWEFCCIWDANVKKQDHRELLTAPSCDKGLISDMHLLNTELMSCPLWCYAGNLNRGVTCILWFSVVSCLFPIVGSFQWGDVVDVMWEMSLLFTIETVPPPRSKWFAPYFTMPIYALKCFGGVNPPTFATFYKRDHQGLTQIVSLPNLTADQVVRLPPVGQGWQQTSHSDKTTSHLSQNYGYR